MKRFFTPHGFSKGFTLVEMLVTVVILLLVLLAVYSFFDQGTWLYLKSEKQTQSQQNARLALEQMERDLRMVGSFVPEGPAVSGGTSWTPFVQFANRSKIIFHADVEGGASVLSADLASGGTTVSVEYPDVVCPAPPNLIVLVMREKKWFPATCNSKTATTITISPGAGDAFASTDSSVWTPDTVFYRLSNDANADGVCDIDYPFCNFERAEVRGNNPVNDIVEANASFTTLATNIAELKFTYMDPDGSAINGGTIPAGGFNTGCCFGNLASIGRIRINITARDRSSEVRKYVDVALSSDVLVRAAKY
jgi:prepilin-type N-terminal cleavage/methylation domain-containing protein